jgi:hypothetical protein
MESVAHAAVLAWKVKRSHESLYFFKTLIALRPLTLLFLRSFPQKPSTKLIIELTMHGWQSSSKSGSL